MYLKKFKWLLSDFKLFCSSDFPFLYIQENFLKKLWKQFNWVLSNFKLFCDSDFPFLHILENVLKNFETQNISKSFEKKHAKDIKSFWRRKRKKAKKGPGQISKSFWRRKRKKVSVLSWSKQNLSEEEKQNKVEYMRNYFLAHKK